MDGITQTPVHELMGNVKDAIKSGEFDQFLGELQKVIAERNEARKQDVLNLVHEVFGETATVQLMRQNSRIDDPNTGSRGGEISIFNAANNPFIKTKTPAEAIQAAQEQQEPLPGPYRINPNDGQAYRVESSSETYLSVTDVFGGHRSSVPVALWNSWSVSVDPTPDPLSDLDETERKMAEEANRVPEGSATNEAPIERRGASISGLHSSDMGN